MRGAGGLRIVSAMNGDGGQTPDRAGEARRSLERALDRLESALAAREARAQAAADDASPELSGALKRENAHLRAANENAAGRLAAAIGRLEKLLGE